MVGCPHTFGHLLHVITKLFHLSQVILCSSFPVHPAPHPRELPWPDPHHPQGLRAGLLHPHDGGVLRAVGSAGEGGGCQTVPVSSQQKRRERKPIKRNITKALPEHRDLSHSRCCVRTRAATQSTGAINAWLSHYLRRHWITVDTYYAFEFGTGAFFISLNLWFSLQNGKEFVSLWIWQWHQTLSNLPALSFLAVLPRCSPVCSHY